MLLGFLGFTRLLGQGGQLVFWHPAGKETSRTPAVAQLGSEMPGFLSAKRFRSRGWFLPGTSQLSLLRRGRWLGCPLGLGRRRLGSAPSSAVGCLMLKSPSLSLLISTTTTRRNNAALNA